MGTRILRYGMLCVLALMSVGILVIADRFEIQTKKPVYLFAGDSVCVAYVASGAGTAFIKGDTMRVMQTAGGELLFRIDSIREEPSYEVFWLSYPYGASALKRRLRGDSFASGYIFTGRQKLRLLLWERINRGN